MAPKSTIPRQATNLALPAAVVQTRQDAWREHNAVAIKAWNRHVEESPLPLEDFRTF